MSTQWRPIPGYGGIYSVSDDGQVYDTNRGRLVSPYLREGYPFVNLQAEKGVRHKRAVHRLVLASFVRLPREGEDEVARHLNGITTDNRVANLRWGSRRENNLDMTRHGTNRNAAKTHCPAGHAYADHAIVTVRNNPQGPSNHRQCRKCKNERLAAAKRQLRAQDNRAASR